jgi:hypothetical protein
MFMFMRPKLVLDVFTYDELLLTTAPIESSMKHTPKWWKGLKRDLATESVPTRNTKDCPAIREYFMGAITIPMWSDMLITINEDKSYAWIFSNPNCAAQVHPDDQVGGFFTASQLGHLKLESPWLIHCKESVKWLWSPPIYGSTVLADVKMFPGVSQFNQSRATHIQLGLNLSSPKSFMIPFGEPIAHLFPLSEREVVIKRHLITKEEYTSRARPFNETFNNTYHIVKEKQELFAGCPYSKHKV